MSMYAFFTENNNTDQLWSDNGITAFSGRIISELPQPIYQLIADPNGIVDLCRDINPLDVANGYFIQFRRADGSFYTCYPQIFVNDHPNQRP